jgi:hypothetical protein
LDDWALLQEHQRQRDYLERKIYTWKQQEDIEHRAHAEDNLRVVKENTALLEEVNALRHELTVATTKEKDQERKLKTLLTKRKLKTVKLPEVYDKMLTLPPALLEDDELKKEDKPEATM